MQKMTQKFKVGQPVTLVKGFPFEGKIFKIVADKRPLGKKQVPSVLRQFLLTMAKTILF